MGGLPAVTCDTRRGEPPGGLSTGATLEGHWCRGPRPHHGHGDATVDTCVLCLPTVKKGKETSDPRRQKHCFSGTLGPCVLPGWVTLGAEPPAGRRKGAVQLLPSS